MNRYKMELKTRNEWKKKKNGKQNRKRFLKQSIDYTRIVIWYEFSLHVYAFDFILVNMFISAITFHIFFFFSFLIWNTAKLACNMNLNEFFSVSWRRMVQKKKKIIYQLKAKTVEIIVQLKFNCANDNNILSRHVTHVI